MPKFGKTSKKRLAECHPELQELFEMVIEVYDCTVLVGHRGEEEQNKAWADNKSQKIFPHSKHNKKPSDGVDVAPWFKTKPHIRWDDTAKFYEFGGLVQGIAFMLDIKIRWGGNWNQNQDLHDQELYDLVHFEIANA